MNDSQKLALSFYKQIAILNQAHNIFLVQHQDTNKIYVKKILNIYNIGIYRELAAHPIRGIPRIIDYYESDKQLIVIEDYVSGCSLEEIIQSSSLQLTDIIHYCMELCKILHRLHELHPPIIHRDIKPSNIIITEYNHVILLDFNAAKFFSASEASDTILLGTKGYAAPEQYGFGSSTPKTDIYALGIMLKELISVLPDIPSDVSKIVEKCTELNPSDRYDNIDDVADELLQCIEPQSKKSLTLSYPKFLPPGFRTHTPWKIILSTCCYLLFFYTSMSLNIENTYGIALWLERIFFYIMLLVPIFIHFNYLNVKKNFFLCQNKHRIIRIFGVVFLDFVLILAIFILMMIIEAAFV